MTWQEIDKYTHPSAKKKTRLTKIWMEWRSEIERERDREKKRNVEMGAEHELEEKQVKAILAQPTRRHTESTR